MSSDGSTYIYALIGGVTMLVSAIKNHRTYRNIENHPTSKASSAAQGLCEFQGFAWPKDICFKNFDGEELIYFNLQVQQQVTRGSGKNKKTYWETQFSKTLESPFYLADASGLVEIQAHQHMESGQKKGNPILDLFLRLNNLKPSHREGFQGTPRTRNWKSISKAEQDFLLTNIILNPPAGFPPTKGLLGLFSGSFRIVESSVAVGSPLYAKGHFSTRAEDAGEKRIFGFTEFSRHVFNHDSRTLKNMNHLVDKNRDGKISEKEIREGYSTFAQKIRAKAVQAGLLDQEKPVSVYGSLGSSSEQNLLLYCMHQEQVVAGLKKKFYFSAVVGTILLTFVIGDLGRKAYPLLEQQQQQNSQEAMIAEQTSYEAALKAEREKQALIKAGRTVKNNEQKDRLPQAQIHQQDSQSAEKVEDLRPQLNSLHHNCVNRMLESSCRKLLSNADQLRLPANYRDYYQGVLCKLGDASQCKN